MGANEREKERILDAFNDGSLESPVDDQLLDAVLSATSDGGKNHALISEIAKNSKFDSCTSLEPFREVVDGILRQSFSKLPISESLINRVAQSVAESPEARDKLEQIWRAARRGDRIDG